MVLASEVLPHTPRTMSRWLRFDCDLSPSYLATATSDISSNHAFAPGLSWEDRPARMRTTLVHVGTLRRVLTRVQSVVPLTGWATSVVVPPIIFPRLSSVVSSSQNCAMITAGLLAFSTLTQPESSYVSPTCQPLATAVQL